MTTNDIFHDTRVAHVRGFKAYLLKRMVRFLNRKSLRYYRLKYADTYYGEMTY